VVNVTPIRVMIANLTAFESRLALDTQFRFWNDRESFFFYFDSTILAVAIRSGQNSPYCPLNTPDIAEGVAFRLLASFMQNPFFLFFSPIQMSNFISKILAHHVDLKKKKSNIFI
jgi:hypothetical protein